MSSEKSGSKLPITAIILTYNEEKNIRDCIESVYHWLDEIYVVDSFSTDRTLEIISEYPDVKMVQHDFENYSTQRNWAFQNLDIANDFIFNLDADHRAMPELADELRNHFSIGIPQNINGFMASRRTMFLGRWIKKGGHYPVYHAIIFRKGHGECEQKNYDQHFIIHGESIVLKSNVIDIITESLSTFTERHNKWATLEAAEAIAYSKEMEAGRVKADKEGNPMEYRRYQRMKYYSYPIFLRVFLYFGYRFVLKGGFLEGKQGLVFHFLQGFWFRFLVDAKIWEMKYNQELNESKTGVKR
ncbi:glycosyltransferase family 2 protein [Jiulongibacter sediminis]|uniref:SpsA n=1 Tax=Jiulongibacter sediminis TaxID=1605367 RepID=A0A0P7BRE3_9BACT|nr:glycosyltransferase family 2 protein [Jiulongibacter sediminis]KPM49851.1 spsA [Jiulongibacter sediminis]TBX26887.1 spsA [Jiulongibacter sediminis]